MGGDPDAPKSRWSEQVVVVERADFGRQGTGPGEIGNARFLVRTKTGIDVYDDRRLAFIRFGIDGEVQEPLPLDSLSATLDALEKVTHLDDGSWIFSVTEILDREAAPKQSQVLYVRANGRSRVIARTPQALTRSVRTACGIGLMGRPPVFWPTLRWSAAGRRVAYAATADDRVVIWDAAGWDSTVLSAGLSAPAASETGAIAATGGLQVSMGSRGCDITPADLVRQRGIAAVIPAIERVTLSPDGTVWTQPAVSAKGRPPIRVFMGNGVDTLTSTVFPAFFLTSSRFVAEEKDSSGTAIASIWEVRRRP